MKNIFKFAVARLSEASTFRGAILLLTGLGVYVRPEVGEAITALGLAIAGVIGVVVPDAGPDLVTPQAPTQ